MSVITKLKIKYNSCFARGIIALAREDYLQAKKWLKSATRCLSELASQRSGTDREYTLDWMFEIVKEIEGIERHISNDSSKEKVKKLLAEKNCHNPDGNGCLHRFEPEHISETTFEDIAGLDDVKAAVFYKAIYPHKFPELYKKLKKRTGGGILLYGLPGTGKTLIAEAIAHETATSFFCVKCSDLGSK